jgi:type 1 glutamine amidotransferase
MTRFLLVLLFSAISASAQNSLRVHLISGSKEYKSQESLRAFQDWLSEHYDIAVTGSWVEDGAADLPGIEKIADADVLLVFARRLKLPEAQMKKVRAHWKADKAVVGIRTASHAFSRQENETFDRKVLGGNYTGHYGDTPVELKNLGEHPILAGVGAFTSRKLYKAGPLAESATLVQTGTTEGDKTESVSWVNTYNSGRSFYTSCGVPSDFADAHFRRMMANAIFWTAKREPKAK